MKIYLIVSLISLIIIQGCGFKKIDRSKYINFDLSEIKMSGDKLINFKLKNALTALSDESNKNLIQIDISTKKNKNVKNKNIKNENTIYNIEISAQINVNVINSGKRFTFNLVEAGSYDVGDKISITVNNERELIDSLIIKLSENIMNKLRFDINDL